MFLLAVPDEIAVLTVADPTPPPPTADPRPARFRADLAVVHAGLAIRNPVDDLPTLARLFNARREAVADRQRRFAADLREVYATVAPPDLEAHLPALGQTLSQWRTRTRSRVANYFSQLPADDPLLCPISLFGVMERGRLETAHTNVLAWLLDPRREHGFGAVFLNALLATLDPSRPVGSVLNIEKCEAEFLIDDGRLDVLAQGASHGDGADVGSWSWLLMIEAKIDANESVQQLKKYDRWARKYSQGREVLRLFLTPEGRPPETATEDWTPMSFLDLGNIIMIYRLG